MLRVRVECVREDPVGVVMSSLSGTHNTDAVGCRHIRRCNQF